MIKTGDWWRGNLNNSDNSCLLEGCVSYLLCPGSVFASASRRFIRNVVLLEFLVGVLMVYATVWTESCVLGVPTRLSFQGKCRG